MNLRNAKILFDLIRNDERRIVPTYHALYDHPERKFTSDVIVALVQGRGRLVDNRMPSAIDGSFIWLCRDEAERDCELVVKFEELDENPNNLILVISAYRKINR